MQVLRKANYDMREYLQVYTEIDLLTWNPVFGLTDTETTLFGDT